MVTRVILVMAIYPEVDLSKSATLNKKLESFVGVRNNCPKFHESHCKHRDRCGAKTLQEGLNPPHGICYSQNRWKWLRDEFCFDTKKAPKTRGWRDSICQLR